MKKIIITIVAATFVCATFAQTPEQLQQGSIGIQTSITNMNLKFTNGVDFGFNVAGGYLIMDKLAGLAVIGLNAIAGQQGEEGITIFNFSLGGRYYPLMLGPGSLFGDFLFNLSTGGPSGATRTIVGIGINAGYAFFLNRHVSIDPLMWLDIPFSKGTRVNLGIGAAITVYL